MKIINLTSAVFLVLGAACAKHDTFANPSPAKFPELKKSAEPRPQCGHRFTTAMNPIEVALTALRMKEDCKMTENEILNLAEKF